MRGLAITDPLRDGDYADPHTHRRNRHGSWRDGEGGALDALTLLESEVEGGAGVAAPSENSKATQVISEPTFAVIQPATLEDASTADASACSGTQCRRPRFARGQRMPRSPVHAALVTRLIAPNA